MENAVSHERKICFLEMRKMSHIRHLIDEETAKKLLLSFVISRLDYCNALFSGITEERLTKLQKVQNHAVRLIKKIPKRDNVKPFLLRLPLASNHINNTVQISSFYFPVLE